LCKFASLKQW